ncbi:MAG: hypothetical protein WBJ13_09480, partial [Sedimentibacter sp.]
GDKQAEGNGNFDLNSLMETFMPLLNSLASNSTEQSKNEQSHEQPQPSHEHSSPEKSIKSSVNTQFKNEINLPEDTEDQNNQEISVNENHTVPNTVDSHRPVRIKQRRRR